MRDEVQQHNEWSRGWPVVLSGMIASGCGITLTYYLFSIFIEPIRAETGWSMAQISQIQGAATIGSLAYPLVGWIMDRYGIRRIYMWGMIGMALLYGALTVIPMQLALFVGLMAVTSVIGLITSPIGYTRAVNAWFVTHRGLALAVSATGIALAAIALPGVISALVENNGWRAGYLAAAALAVIIGVPAVWHLTQTPPDAVRAHVTAHTDMTVAKGWMKTRAFWLLVINFIGINLPGSAIMGQMVPMLQKEGLAATEAAFGISAYAAGQFFGRLGCGWFIDRFRPGPIAAAFTIVPVIGCVVLWQGEVGFVIAMFAVFAIGVQQGAEIDLLSWYTARNFGLGSYGSIFGWTQLAGWLGTIVGIGMIGWLRDTTGGYGTFQVIAMACYGIAAVAILLAPVAPVKAALTN